MLILTGWVTLRTSGSDAPVSAQGRMGEASGTVAISIFLTKEGQMKLASAPSPTELELGAEFPAR